MANKCMTHEEQKKKLKNMYPTCTDFMHQLPSCPGRLRHLKITIIPIINSSKMI